MLRGVTLVIACFSLSAAAPSPLGGEFARHAIAVMNRMKMHGRSDAPMSGSFETHSPDGHSRITATFRESGNELGGSFTAITRYRLSGRAGEAAISTQGPPNHDEILWSPDSMRAALSLGGELVLIGGHHSHARNISKLFRALLNPPANCDLRAFSSVGAVKWLSPTRLLVAAQQMWEDSCPQRYHAMLYEYDLPAHRVVRSMSVREARRSYPGVLGERFH